MIWLTWRQFRAQALTALAILAAATAYFVITGLQMHHTYTADLAACTPLGSCDSTLNDFQRIYDMAFHLSELAGGRHPGTDRDVLGCPADRP